MYFLSDEHFMSLRNIVLYSCVSVHCVIVGARCAWVGLHTVLPDHSVFMDWLVKF